MNQLHTAAERIQCYIGSAATGKTHSLIRCASLLKDEGVNPAHIIAFAASPDAAKAFSARLSEELGDFASSIQVTTPRSFALSLLSTEEARAFTGRAGRMAAPHEENFLLEDMKTSGLRPRRLKEMLKFFYRSWSELANDDLSWLISLEERTIYGLLQECLNHTGIILEPEISRLAVEFLSRCPESRAMHTMPHVLVDDYQNMSRASQALVSQIATESLYVAGDDQVSVQVYDSYPYTAGLHEFVQANECTPVLLETCQRPQRIADACIAWRDLSSCDNIQDTVAKMPAPSHANCVSAASGNELEYLCYENPAEEFVGIANLVSSTLSKNEGDSKIFIAVPNSAWRSNAIRALRAQNIKVSQKPFTRALGADVRDNDRCLTVRCFTLLQLAANPNDNAAWRSWCGFGDYLTNSGAFLDMRKLIGEQKEHSDYLGVLKGLGRTGFNSFIFNSQAVATSFNNCCRDLEALAGLHGMTLLNTIGTLVTKKANTAAPADLIALCGPVNDNDTAQVLLERAMQRIQEPAFDDQSKVVFIGDATDAVGMEFDLVVHMGFVNGFVPHRDSFDATKKSPEQRQRMKSTDLRNLHALAGTAKHRLILSFFQQIDPESAEFLKLKVDRLRLVKGKRVCLLSPCEFIRALQ